MGIQEIVTFLIVGVAILYAGRKFIRQFTHGDQELPKCADCALNRMQPVKKNKA